MDEGASRRRGKEDVLKADEEACGFGVTTVDMHGTDVDATRWLSPGTS